jgi:hypothetical protein
MAGLQLPNKSLFHVSKINRRRVRDPKPGGINPLPLQPRFRNRRGQVSCDPAGRLSMCSKGPRRLSCSISGDSEKSPTVAPAPEFRPETPMHTTVDEWIARDPVPFTDEGIDRMVSTMPEVDLLGFGEALHGGEEILQLRNRLFRRLVEWHGFRAIAIESSFPQSQFVNEHAGGGGDAPNFTDWISNGMGLLEANRELIAWMRQHNATHDDKVHFYGFDMPLGKMAFASPRLVLEGLYDLVPERRERIESLIGGDGDWENPAVIGDPAKGVGGTPRANDLDTP